MPKGDAAKLTAEIELNSELVAPIQKGEAIGQVIYSVDGDEVASATLVAQQEVQEGSIFKKLMDWFKRLVSSWF